MTGDIRRPRYASEDIQQLDGMQVDHSLHVCEL